MPDVPKITDDTPGGATVYIENPHDKSIGTATVDQWRELYEPKGWKLSTPEAYREHDAKLAAELRDIQTNNPDLLYPPTGKTAAQVATSRATKEA
jgi:transposase